MAPVVVVAPRPGGARAVVVAVPPLPVDPDGDRVMCARPEGEGGAAVVVFVPPPVDEEGDRLVPFRRAPAVAKVRGRLGIRRYAGILGTLVRGTIAASPARRGT